MLALLDLGLFVLSSEAWTRERERCIRPMEAMVIHGRFLRPYPIRLLWSDQFFDGFPWNEPRCPRELRDACVAINALIDHLRSNNRLILAEELGKPPSTRPILEPDLMAEEHGHPEQQRIVWLNLLGAFLCHGEFSQHAFAVPTWERPLQGELSCTRFDMDSDTAAQIVNAVVNHFRANSELEA